jgi:hypothetical protein
LTKSIACAVFVLALALASSGCDSIPTVTPTAALTATPTTAAPTVTPSSTATRTPTPTATQRPQPTVCPVATLMITCCVDADDDAKCAPDDLPVYCVMMLGYDIGVQQPVIWEVTAGAGGVAIVALTPGQYTVTIHAFTAIIPVAPDYRQVNTIVLNAGRDERVDVAFVNRVPIPTATPIVTPTPTPAPVTACPAYQINCLPNATPCPAGRVDTGQQCGSGFHCCAGVRP